MDEGSECESSFTIEEMRSDDPRLRQLLEIPEEEKRSSSSAFIQLVSGSDGLEIEDVGLWNQFHLTDEDFNRLRTIGLKGKLRVIGWGTSGYAPYKARTLIVARHQIREAIDLAQPDGCDVIYYQVGDEWRRFPADAPVLKKRFRLSIDPGNENRTNIWEEAYFSSKEGSGGGFTWELFAADGAIARFSSTLVPPNLNANRAPQLKAGVRSTLVMGETSMTVLTTYLFTMLMALGLAQPSPGLVMTAGDLGLRLTADNTALRVEERPIVHVAVTNNGSDTVTLVQPGDGSESGWRTPIVAWSVIEVNGGAQHPSEPTPNPGPRMCGNINALKSDEVFALAPGETKELKGWVYLEPFKEPGVYRVMFLYANRPALEWKGIPLGEHDKLAMWFIQLSTTVTLSSNELVFTIRS